MVRKATAAVTESVDVHDSKSCGATHESSSLSRGTLNENLKPKIIAIVGATASGKTALSLALAERFQGEIISADSRQVYRGLNIGTAKATHAERARVPHHLIDIVDPHTSFTAHDFAEHANRAITSIVSRDHLPIIVGGTFFYLDQLRGTAGRASVPPNPMLRATLEQLSLEDLTAKIAYFDPALLEKIDSRNPRRLIRALEILDALGHIPPLTTAENPYEWLTIGLIAEKETLRARYKERAESWLKAGFLTEITTLLAHNISRARLQEIGFEYTLGLALYDKTISEETFVQRFIEKNWQYAKRQLLWLKRDHTIQWFSPETESEIFSTVERFLQD